MRPLTLASAALAVACVAPQRTVVTVTTRTEVGIAERAIADGANPGARPTVVLSPPTLDRLDPAALASLSAHGRWEESVAYGRVWVPFQAYTNNFVPYLTRGAWVASGDGWYWQSDYAWGQIPFHYGRWAQVEGVWAWVPGSTFSPAWVEWRAGGSWVGWSPLAPLGAAPAAPFAYCNGTSLQGPGLQARTVTGPAAFSLFPATAPLPTGPALPAQALLDARTLLARAPFDEPRTPVALDLSQRPPACDPPATLEPVPRALVTAVAAAGVPADEAPTAGGRSVGVIRDGDNGATLVLADGRFQPRAGYSTVPAAPPSAVPARRPQARTLLARVTVTARPGWERAVATPPAVVELPGAPVLPGYAGWGGARTYGDGGMAMRPQPLIRALGGLGPGGSSVPTGNPVVPSPVISAGGGAPAGVTASGGQVALPPLSVR
ncbi:MAG: DUF6600 domain-containing protein [Polyangiales bacterium]